jgi:uncharacterized membrane protein YgcG
MFILFSIISGQIVARELPNLNNPIFDEAGVLSFTFEKRMNNYLEEFAQVNQVKVRLALIESLGGESIDEFSERSLLTINNANDEQTILLILSISDRSIKISSSTFDLISDEKISGIVDSIIPYIKNHQYEKASVLFSDLVIYSIDSAFVLDAPPVTNKSYLNTKGLIFFLILIIFMFILGRKFFNERIVFTSNSKAKPKTRLTGSWS